MHNTKIVTISGKARHGKDTCADFIKEKLEDLGKKVLVLHYGDYLKMVCEKYFGWDGQKNEKGREILQQIGTNKIRSKEPDFWVSVVEKIMSVLDGDFDYFLIPDTRFPNEIEYLKFFKWDVTTLKVVRKDFVSNLTPEQLNHPSETALDNYIFDYVIEAPSGVEHLEYDCECFADGITHVY